MSGSILCGTTISFQNGALAKILSLSGLGANRRIIDLTDGDSPDLWREFIGSCIAGLKPFRVQVSFLTNFDWVPLMQGPPAPLVITWPIQIPTYTTAGTLGFSAFVSDLNIGGELESRLTKDWEVQGTGKPIVTPGTLA